MKRNYSKVQHTLGVPEKGELEKNPQINKQKVKINGGPEF